MQDVFETYRGVVKPAERDHYGHMNVQFYVARVSDASSTMMNAMGLTAAVMRAEKLGFAAIDQRFQYLREAHEGDLMVMRSHLVSAEGKKIVLAHELSNATTGVVAMKAEVLALMLDLEARRAVAIPPSILAILAKGGQHEPEPAKAPPLPTHRSVVNAWHTDRMQHMNIQFYMERMDEADAFVAAALGDTPLTRRDSGAGLMPVEQRITFMHEQIAGAVTAARSGVRGLEGDAVLWHTDLRQSDTDQSAARFETRSVYADLATGTPLPLPPALRARAMEEAAGWTHAALPRPLGPPPATEPAGTAFDTARLGTQAWECDRHGWLMPRFMMRMLSDSTIHAFVRFGLPHSELQARGLGGAALEYRIVTRRRIRNGDAVAISCAPVEMSGKTWRFAHWVRNAVTGELLATAETVAVLFDFATRKAVPLPPDIHAKIAALMAG